MLPFGALSSVSWLRFLFSSIPFVSPQTGNGVLEGLVSAELPPPLWGVVSSAGRPIVGPQGGGGLKHRPESAPKPLTQPISEEQNTVQVQDGASRVWGVATSLHHAGSSLEPI